MIYWWLRKHWWKALGGVFVLYSLVIGLATPLSPTIFEINPNVVEAGWNRDLEVRVKNVDLERLTKDPVIWIESGEASYCGDRVRIKGRSRLLFDLHLPGTLPKDAIHLYVHLPGKETLVLTDAFRSRDIEQNEGGLPDNKKAECLKGLDFEGDGGFAFPSRKILYESIRNLFYHVPMWFAMIGVMALSFMGSIRYLSAPSGNRDLFAVESVKVGLLFAVLGLLTGSLWARFTWGAWWVSDPKLNGAAVSVLIYLAYLVLRNAVEEAQLRGKVAAVYNIFAFCLLIVFLLILPRTTDSLHPGSGGNPAFSRYDLDNNMRLVFYPAVIGWFLIGVWITRLRVRTGMAFKALRRRS